VAADILEQWNYEETASNHFTARDRSAIYGGVHLYVRRST
jgi:S-adenosylmethionine-diacylglycerol 3-amino-3-carboxypropyl transferase